MVQLGEYSLYLTLPFALFAMGAAAYGALRDRPEWVRSAERAVHATFALLCLAFIGLEVALIGDRFDLAFVYSISSREQPLMFKLALWGGHDGSLLLWGWLLAAMTSLVVFQNRERNRRLIPWVVVSQMANVLFFTALMSFSKNPFAAAEVVLSNGAGMNPILQHPVMLIHPPILYVGFVGFSVPFSFALAALISGELGTSWFRTTRRWTLVAWFFLGIGLMLGGRWAYEVLGWGGYWAWDPVENSSLMPWLAGTAFVHSVMIQEKRGMLKVWNLALIGLTYSLCLFGTYLTRSGVVQSVHSFANAGYFGLFFLGYVIATGSVFTYFLVRRLPDLRSKNRLDSVLSREGSFLLNNYVFLGLLAIVLFGTLYPVFSEYVTGTRVQIGPPFFQRLAGPLAIFLLLLTGIGPLIAWRRATWTNLRKSFLWPAGVAAVAGVGIRAIGVDQFYPWAFLTLCVFVTGTITEEYARGIRARMRRGEGPLRAFGELLRRNQRRYGGYIVHLSVILMFVGFAGAAFELEETKLLKPGERWDLAGYTVEYRSAQPVSHPHYAGAVARLALWDQGEPVGILLPEKRVYMQQEQPTTLPAVSSNLREDFYVILTGLEPDQSAALKVYINPLVNWLWIGGFVFVFGNTLLLWRMPEPRPMPSSRPMPSPGAATRDGAA
ncbi:MAG: heme lyase CcmF/NrfE family subunit [Deltaproteobacteria bacterium]|nr:heme lyase CcmF/NrfE family subunit [Deltaproteobacteria bacterium]